jgi:hypothetical protein
MGFATIRRPGIIADTALATIKQWMKLTSDNIDSINQGIPVSSGTEPPARFHDIGEMYITSAGVLKICTTAGDPGTFVSVGTQT